MKLQWLVRMDLKCVCERERGRDRENTGGYFLEVSVKINTWRAPKKKKKKTRDGGWQSFGVSRACMWVNECDGNHESRVRERESENISISNLSPTHIVSTLPSSQLSVNEFYEEALSFFILVVDDNADTLD